MRWMRYGWLGVVIGLTTACGTGAGTYCQSGSRYGTQCYSLADIQTPPGQAPPPADTSPHDLTPRR